MANNPENDQDRRAGGYGGSTGGENPKENPQQAGQKSTEEQPTGATGRDTPGGNALDSDEALGNRTGGYGGNPASTDK